MTAAALLVDLSVLGIRVEASGDRLHWKGPGDAMTPALRVRLVEHKVELLALLNDPGAKLRTHLRNLAEAEDLPVAVVDELPDADVVACKGFPDATLRAYLRALHKAVRMDAGIIPEDYTEARHCEGCGPVWLWLGAPERIIACPWCFRRKAGKPFPRPTGNRAHQVRGAAP